MKATATSVTFGWNPGLGAEAVATLLYPVTSRSFRELYEFAAGWSGALRREVIDAALGSRTRRDELLRAFHGGPYVYDIVMDVGAYRDLHRHRRCRQYRQAYEAFNADLAAFAAAVKAARVAIDADQDVVAQLGRLFENNVLTV